VEHRVNHVLTWLNKTYGKYNDHQGLEESFCDISALKIQDIAPTRNEIPTIAHFSANALNLPERPTSIPFWVDLG